MRFKVVCRDNNQTWAIFLHHADAVEYRSVKNREAGKNRFRIVEIEGES